MMNALISVYLSEKTPKRKNLLILPTNEKDTFDIYTSDSYTISMNSEQLDAENQKVTRRRFTRNPVIDGGAYLIIKNKSEDGKAYHYVFPYYPNDIDPITPKPETHIIGNSVDIEQKNVPNDGIEIPGFRDGDSKYHDVMVLLDGIKETCVINGEPILISQKNAQMYDVNTLGSGWNAERLSTSCEQQEKKHNNHITKKEHIALSRENISKIITTNTRKHIIIIPQSGSNYADMYLFTEDDVS